MRPLGMGPVTFRLVTMHLKQLRHRVPASILLCVEIYRMCGLVVLAKVKVKCSRYRPDCGPEGG